MQDIYFERNYARLYEEIENGVSEIFVFEHALGSVRHLYIKKEIPILYNNEKYYDLVTPYGYGGPLMSDCEDENKLTLAKAFEKEFQHYCFSNHIICESVRFHPILLNAFSFKGCYELVHRSKTTGTSLSSFEDPVQEEFSKSTRKNIRRALREGVEYNIISNPKNLDSFKNIYHKTMKRLNADELYFFDDQYFSDFLKYFGERIVLVEAIYERQVIGMEMHLVYGDYIHTHLSGTLEEFHHLFPVYVMTYAITIWGKENGFKIIHSGGGLSSQPDDSLFLFKKKFGKQTEFDYYTGYKIWNEKIYSEICEHVGADKSIVSFPAYRNIHDSSNKNSLLVR